MVDVRKAESARKALMVSLETLEEIQRVTSETDWEDEWSVQTQRVRELRTGLEGIVTDLVLTRVKPLVKFGRELEGVLERKKIWERHETFKNSFAERAEEIEVIAENVRKVLVKYLEKVEHAIYVGRAS